MTTDEKLAAILAAVQIDPGNRGLARDPHDNLFTATAGDFQAACQSIVKAEKPHLGVVTGFFIPSSSPPAFETDGPLGAIFLARALPALSIAVTLYSEPKGHRSHAVAIRQFGFSAQAESLVVDSNGVVALPSENRFSHLIALERGGPAVDNRCYTMRGRDISHEMLPVRTWFETPQRAASIGIGDGGNEVGMGKVPHETIVKNIPNGDQIHCRVPTDHLIVAGVSNWGAYALAAGIYVLRGVKPPTDLFDPDREREILEVMVREGPLVDGVTGQQTATVDGLSWGEYVKPLVRIREILEA